MDQKNIKKRDVWTFDEFAESYDQARKVVMLKKDEEAHPGTHKIEAEGSYVRHDANPYKAFGIPHKEAEANVNDRMNANRVHVFDQTKNNRVEVITQNKPVGEGVSANDVVVNTATIVGSDIDESAKTDANKVEGKDEETEK